MKKKKLVAMMLASTMILSLSACGGSASSDSGSDKSAAKTEQSSESDNGSNSKEEVKKDLPDGDYQDCGNGSIVLSTSGGTSENGNVPVVYVSPDDTLLQIGLDSYEFDGSKLSFIYIDGMLVSKEQLSESQTTLDLSDQALTSGTHKVEVLQYDGDSPESSYVTYKTASYEIKEK